MEIRSGFDGLSSLLGVNATDGAQGRGKGQAAGVEALGSDRATLSSAASQMAQAAGEDGVRPEKVAAIQAALAAGSYSVPASAVASKMVDAMLGGGK
jgi:negative regulator of flagellin synthesis FlgM